MTKLVRFDWAIKYLLKNKTNFDILEGFLSELLNTNINIESILESESNKDTKHDKFNRVDLLARNTKQEKFIIEVQTTSQWDYLCRILYGTSKVVTEYLKEGDEYKDIRKVISVSVVFFNVGEGEDYIYRGTTVFKGRHSHDILKLNADEQSVYGIEHQTPSDIYPEYYIIKVNQFNERIKDKFDEWVYFLKNSQIKSTFNAKGIHSAAEKLNVLRLNEQDRRAYERYKDDLHYEASMIASHYGRGIKKGTEQGREQGREEGREEIRSLLLLLLQQKFTFIPEPYHQKIKQATHESLHTWFERVLKSQTIGAVFEEKEYELEH